MKKNIKIISIAILCWVVLFALATYAGPTEQIQEGTILQINDMGNGGNMKMAIVIDNVNNHNYHILLTPNVLPRAVYSNVGERIIFRLMRAAGNEGHEGVQVHQPLRMK